MMRPHLVLTRHAHERSTGRSIPPLVAEFIVEYGQSFDAGDGTRKYFLTKDSLRAIRRHGGPEFAKVLAPYRNRGAYALLAGDRVVTLAYAN